MKTVLKKIFNKQNLYAFLFLMWFFSAGSKSTEAMCHGEAELSLLVKKSNHRYNGILYIKKNANFWGTFTKSEKSSRLIFLYYVIEEWSSKKRSFVAVDFFGQDSSPGVKIFPSGKKLFFKVEYKFRNNKKYRIGFQYYDSDEALKLIEKRGPLTELEQVELNKMRKFKFSTPFIHRVVRFKAKKLKA